MVTFPKIQDLKHVTLRFAEIFAEILYSVNVNSL